MPQTRDSIVQALREALAHRPEVGVALLFGSRARGTAVETSDVDLAVSGRFIDVLELAAELSTVVGREVDVVETRGASIPLPEALLREGVVVHEGRRGAAALWRSVALAQLETDRPWYARMREAWLARVAREGLSG